MQSGKLNLIWGSQFYNYLPRWESEVQFLTYTLDQCNDHGCFFLPIVAPCIVWQISRSGEVVLMFSPTGYCVSSKKKSFKKMCPCLSNLWLHVFEQILFVWSPLHVIPMKYRFPKWQTFTVISVDWILPIVLVSIRWKEIRPNVLFIDWSRSLF